MIKNIKNKIAKLIDNHSSFNKRSSSSGYTLLFTVLITSIILSIALGISRVSYTELVLTSVSREGSRAFFAADSGLECGLYADLESNVFALSPTSDFYCAGLDFFGEETELDLISNKNRFNFEIDLSGDACARIYVYKDWEIDEFPGETFTRVESLGYNRSCEIVESTFTGGILGQDSNLVERALRATYKNDLQLGGGGGNGTPPGQDLDS
jgi:hypothetical protein